VSAARASQDSPSPGRPGDGPAPALTSAERPRELTARALIVGCAIGVVLAAGNVYMGLKTSFIDGGSITAALLGFTFFATFKSLARASSYTVLENNITQTTAASAAVMGYVVGVSAPIPALSLMGREFPAWALITWGICMGAVGILMAASLRRKLVVAEALPFPTGAATAEVIEAIFAARQTALRRARVLIGSAVVAMAVTWFRDGRPAVIPQMTLFGTMLAGVSTASLGLGMSWSPLMLSTGAIMGLRAGASMLVGAAISWVGLAPWLVRRGIVHGSSFTDVGSWLVWPAVGLLVAGSFVPLVLDWRAVWRSFRDLPTLLRRRGDDDTADGDPRENFRHGKPILFVCLVVLVWVGWVAFRLHPVVTLLTLVLAVVLANIVARTAGETDLAPIGSVGTLTQLVLAGNGPVVSLIGGWLTSGEASQTSQTLWALKAGHRLRASPRAQIWAQLLGAVMGATVVVPVYLVLVKSYGLGTAAMPAVSALSWKATAEAVRGGLSAMPPYGPLAGGVGFCVGVLLAVLGRTRVGRFLPSPAAMGVAVLSPASLSVAAFAGSVAATAVQRLRPQVSEASIVSMAAGGIAGESLMGVIIAMLMASGLL
jgi:uncharacterized oligopeptide transporter (OPT) family protein